jgi:hypothetical protein
LILKTSEWEFAKGNEFKTLAFSTPRYQAFARDFLAFSISSSLRPHIISEVMDLILGSSNSIMMQKFGLFKGVYAIYINDVFNNYYLASKEMWFSMAFIYSSGLQANSWSLQGNLRDDIFQF